MLWSCQDSLIIIIFEAGRDKIFLNINTIFYQKGIILKGIDLLTGSIVNFSSVSPIYRKFVVTSFKRTVSRDGYLFWRSKHFSLYFLCMRWWFSRSFKNFSLPCTIITPFCLLLLNYLLILKCLLKPSSEFLSLWLVNFLQCRPLIGWRENAQE